MSMQLLPPSEDLHCSIELLIKSVDEHADPQGYAVTKKRSKKSKKGVTMKVWLCCDLWPRAIQKDEEVIDVSATSSSVVVTASTATASEDILRVQEPAIGSLSGDDEPLKSLHSESRLASNSWKSFRRAGLSRQLSLNKPLEAVKNVNEDENEDEVKQEMKQEMVKLQAFQTA